MLKDGYGRRPGAGGLHSTPPDALPQCTHRSCVSAAKGGDVAMTMVRGRILYENGKFPTLDLPGAVEA